MLNKILRTGTASALLLVATTASAQVKVQIEPPAREQPPVGSQPAMAGATYRVKQVLGSKVLIGTSGVGTVDDIVFDSAGNLEYMIVANEGKLVTVPWDAAKFDLKAQTAVLTITPDVYRTIPTFTATTYPEFYTPAYRTQVYKYYGLTPRELRRMDRRDR